MPRAAPGVVTGTFGRGAGFLPGDRAGSTSDSGQYT